MNKPRVLVVEDEVLVAENIRGRLQNLGYEVPAVTSSGAEAVRIAGEIRPDVVLMDIQLEGEIDGVEAAAQIRAGANVPVIYLTAHINESILERVKLTAPYGYILKPYQIRELHTTIELALSKHELETKLQESETRYRQLFEGINDAVMVYSHQGYFLDCNRTALRWLGYSREEFLRLTAADIVHPDFHSTMQANQEQLWTGENLVIESAHLSQDGRKIPVEINAQCIDYQGDPAILAVVRDITERKQAEAELSRYRHHLEELVEERTAKLTEVNRQLQQEIGERERAEEQVKASLREKEVLLKEIHHRVKNNLQIISSLLYLQAKKIKDEGVLEIFQEGQNRIKSMALVHEKLYQSSNLARINFTEYVSNLITYLFRSYGTSSHRITRKIKINRNLELAISKAIPCGLIINELVSNVLKYSFPPELKQSGEICIEMEAIEGDEFRLIISDNGVGLPPEIDFQNTSSLGLQLVNNLVRQMDGTIELDRSAGTRYTITF